MTIMRFSKDFKLFLIAQSISWFGASVTPTALTLGLLKLKFSPAQVGLVVAANSIALIALLSVGGVLADRLSKFKVGYLSQLLNIVSLSFIFWLFYCNNMNIISYIIPSILAGVSFSFAGPVSKGVIKELVNPDLVGKANSLRSILRNISYIIGPSLAAILISLKSAYFAIAIDIFSCFIVFVIFIYLDKNVDTSRKVTSAVRENYLYDFKMGVRYYLSVSWIWKVSLCYFFTNFIYAGVWLILAPTEISARLGEGEWGLLLSMRAVGLLLAGIYSYKFTHNKPIMAMSVGSSFGGLMFLFVGAQSPYWILVITAVLFGFGSSLSTITWDSLIVKKVPSASISRITSLDMMLSFAAVPLGQILSLIHI